MVENEPYTIELRSTKQHDTYYRGILSKVTIECINYDTFTTLNDVIISILAKEEHDANKNNEQEN